MRFSLHYRGPLRANGNPKHKHDLRLHLHRQLSVLWAQGPLSGHADLLLETPRDRSVSILRRRGDVVFAPLACEVLKTTCELSVVLLRPEPPGRILTQGGDIDNRLKTLFDALTLPQAQGLPKGWKPTAGERPMYCLLEDDNLITSVAVRTEQLLEPGVDGAIVDATIHVRTRVTEMLVGNLDFA